MQADVFFGGGVFGVLDVQRVEAGDSRETGAEKREDFSGPSEKAGVEIRVVPATVSIDDIRRWVGRHLKDTRK